MKRSLWLHFFLFGFIILSAHAQNWSGNLSVDPYPSPYLSDWETDPTLGSLEIMNNTSESDVVIAYLDITSTDGSIGFQGTSRRLLVEPGIPVYMLSTELQDWNTGTLSEDIKQQVTQTGMIPEGTYEVTVEVRNLWGTTLVDNLSAFFTITHPEPPELIYPVDSEMIYSPYPVFQWIDMQLPPGKEAIFTIRIVEVLYGQTAETALNANYPHYENFNVFESNFEYPLDGQEIEANKTYAWQIYALDYKGLPITKNNGKSEIGVFTTSGDLAGVLPELELISPDDEAIVYTASPQFEWLEPAVTVDGLIYYTLKIVPVYAHQSPAEAMQTNTPHFINSGTLTETLFRYPSGENPFISGDRYAWQVTARDHYGYPATSNEGKSEIYTFTIMGGEVPENLEDLLPEYLPLPTQEIAYLQLKQGNTCYVNCSLNADSTQIILQSKSSNSVPLYFPSLSGTSTDIQTGATVNLTLDRFTIEILNGTVTASPSATWQSPFHLTHIGMPLAVQSIAFSTESGGQFSLSAAVAAFGSVSKQSPVEITITSDGYFYGLVQSGPIDLMLSSITGQQFGLNWTDVNGVIGTGQSMQDIDFDIGLEGNLIFENTASPSIMSISCNMTRDDLVFSTQGGSIVLQRGPYNITLMLSSIDHLAYADNSSSLDYDFAFDMIVSLPRFTPPVQLPLLPDIHLTPDGLLIPESDLLLSGYSLTANGIRMIPDASRIAETRLDLSNSSSLPVFKFDMALELISLPPRLTTLTSPPLTVLNAELTTSGFVGSIETRTYLAPVRAPVVNGADWGFDIHEIQGTLNTNLKTPLTLLLSADFVPPQLLRTQGVSSISLPGTSLHLDTDGIFNTRYDNVFANITLPWDVLTVHCSQGDLIFDRSSSVQTAGFEYEGYIEIPSLPPDQPVQASGRGYYDLLNFRISSGTFSTSDPFTIGLPGQDPVMKCRCLSGATIDPSGIHLADGQGQLLLDGGQTMDIEYAQNVVLSTSNLIPETGVVQFSEPFTLRVRNLRGTAADLEWLALGSATTISPNTEELLITIPGSARIENGMLVNANRSTGQLRYADLEFSSLQTEFSSDFNLEFDPPGIAQGRIQFLSENQVIATIDSKGFWPSDIFSQENLGESVRLPLPHESIAYIQLMDTSGNWLIDHQDSGLDIYLNTTASLVLPGLQYGQSSPPSIQVTLNNVTVNRANMQITQGTIEANASTGSLLNLNGSGLPLEIVRLYYDNVNQKLMAGIQLSLPGVFENSGLTLPEIEVHATGLSDFQSGSAQSPLLTLSVGPDITCIVEQVDASMMNTSGKVQLTGHLLIAPFQENNVCKPVDYTMNLSPQTAEFSTQPTYSDASGYALPMGKAILRITDDSGVSQIDIQAPFNNDNLIVKFESLILSMPEFGNGLRLLLNNLIVDKNGIQPPSIPTDPAQSFGLCGLDFTLQGTQNVSWVSTPPGLEVTMTGNLRLLSQDVAFSNFMLNTDGSVGGQNILSQTTSALNNLIQFSSIQAQNNLLNINGTLTPLTPFEMGGGQAFVLRIDPNGNWVDENGDRLNERRIVALEDESANGKDILLGSLPLQVRCRLAGLSAQFTSSLTEATGSLNVLINTYWPKFDLENPLETEEKLLLTGEIQFDEGNLQQETWSIEDKTIPAFVLAELIKLEVDNLAASSENGFKILLGGNLTLNCLPEGSGGCEFEDFALTPETTVFGTIHDGELDFYGLNLSVSDFSYGTDTQSFDFSTGSLETGTMETSTRTIGGGDNNFYVTFGASISTDMEGFSGGVDRLIIYKGSDKFYMLIENANFEISEAVKGRLDMEALIPLTLENFEFQLSMGGSLTIQETGFAAVGEIAFKEDRIFGQDVKMPSMGLFFGLVGMDIVLVPLPISLTDIGGGIFFNPTEKIEGWVTTHCGLDNESQWLKDSFGEYKQTNPLVTVFFLAGLAIPNKDGLIRGRLLYTIASDHIRLDNEVTIFSSGAMSNYLNISAKGHFAAGLQNLISEGSFTDFYIEGCTEATITLKKLCDIAPKATFAFGVVKSGSEFHWGIQGTMNIDILSILTADYSLFVGDPGFLIQGEISAGFDIGIIAIDAGLSNAIWIVWDPNSPSMGAYLTGYISAEVFWGAAWARGELGAALMVLPSVYMYGYAELDCGFLGWDWNESAWVKWENGSIDGGLGENEGMDVVLEEAERAANAIKGQAQEIQGDLAASSIPIRLGIDEAMMQQIIQNMSAGRADLYDALEEDRQFVVEILNALSFGQHVSTFNSYVSTLRNGLSPTYIGGIKTLRNSATNYQDDYQTALTNHINKLGDNFQKAENELSSLDYDLSGTLGGGDSLNTMENPLTTSGSSGNGSVPTFTVDASKSEANKSGCTSYSSSIGTSLSEIALEIDRLDSIRSVIYQTIGPNSGINQIQSAFVSPLSGIPDETLIFGDMNGYFNTYGSMKREINTHVYGADDPLAVLLRSLQNMISFENAEVNYYEEAFKNSINLRKETIDALADTLRDLDAFDLNIEEMRQAAQLTAQQFYGDIPMAFSTYTQRQLDSLFIRITKVYKNYLEDKGSLHHNLTVKTDEMWDRYAEFTEKLYTAYQQYIALAKSNEQGLTEDVKASLSSMENRMNTLEQELYLPSPSNVQVTRETSSNRYAHADVSITLGSSSADLSEYAFQWLENGFQAVGTTNQFSQPMYPATIGGTENYTLKGRYRNKSGLTVESSPVEFSIPYSGSSVGTATYSTPVASNPPKWTLSWPLPYLTVLTPHQSLTGTMSNSGVQRGAHILSSGSGVKIQWPHAIDQGSGGIAQYEVCVKTEDGSFVKNWTGTISKDSANVLFDMEPLVPYYVHVRARDLAGLYSESITAPNGWPVVYNQNPYGFPDNSDPSVLYTNEELSISLPLAGYYLFESSDDGLCIKYISSKYEFQIITDGSAPDASAWKRVSDYGSDIVISTYFGTIKFYTRNTETALIPQSLIFRQAFKIALRVIDPNTDEIMVSSKIFEVSRLDDPIGPWNLDAVFKGWDMNESIKIKITRPAQDDETGIAGMQYAVGRTETALTIRPFPESSGDSPVFDFGPEYNKIDEILTCDVSLSSVELARENFVVVLRIFNGQYKYRDYVIPDRVYGASYTPNVELNYDDNDRPYLSMAIQSVQAFHLVLFETGSVEPVHTVTKYSASPPLKISLPENLDIQKTYRAAIQMQSYSNYYTPVYFVSFTLPLHFPPIDASIVYDGRFNKLLIQGQLNERAVSEGVETLQFDLGSSWSKPDILPTTAFRISGDFERSFILSENIKPGQFVYFTAYVLNQTDAQSPKMNVQLKIPFPELFTSTDLYFIKDIAEYQLHFYGTLNAEALKGDIDYIKFLLGSQRGKNDILGGTPVAIKLSAGQTTVDHVFRVANDKIQPGNTLVLSFVINPQNVNTADTSYVEISVPNVPAPQLEAEIVHYQDGRDMLTCRSEETAWNDLDRIEFRVGTDRGLSDVAVERALTATHPESEILLNPAYKGKILYISAKGVTDDGSQSPMMYYQIKYSNLQIPQLSGDITRLTNQFLLRLYREPGTLSSAISYLEIWAGTETGSDNVISSSKHWTSGQPLTFDNLFSAGLWTGENELQVTARYVSLTGEISPAVYFTATRTDYSPIIGSVTEKNMKPELSFQSVGFNGELEIAGYQYAMGSQPGQYDIRPFPFDISTYDYGPTAVQAGGTLLLPNSTTSMPESVWIAFQAISVQGDKQKSEIGFEPRPRAPECLALLHNRPVQNDQTFTVQIDPATVRDADEALLNVTVKHQGRNYIVWSDIPFKDYISPSGFSRGVTLPYMLGLNESLQVTIYYIVPDKNGYYKRSYITNLEANFE